jgi:hypothetical protein
MGSRDGKAMVLELHRRALGNLSPQVLDLLGEGLIIVVIKIRNGSDQDTERSGATCTG